MNESSEWWRYDIETPSYRSVFTDYHAACGLVQLGKINKKLHKKRSIREIYKEKLKVDYLNNSVEEHSNYFFTIRSNNRDYIAKSLKESGVYCSLRYWRMDKTNIIKFTEWPTNMPGADIFYNKCLNIPIHANLSNNDVSYICEVINKNK